MSYFPIFVFILIKNTKYCTEVSFVPNIEHQKPKFHYLVNGHLDLLNGQYKSSKHLYLAFIKYDVFP